MTAVPKAKDAWWVDFYDLWLEAVLLDGTGASTTERTVDFLLATLDLGPGDVLYDQCCGNGRLSIPLAGRGLCVHGLDQASEYIERAKARALEAGVAADFVCGDAFEAVVGPSDAVINWWTSFGYAKEDAQNLKMLQRARDSLRPGGKFALDFINVPGLLSRFAPAVVDRLSRGEEEILLLRESRLDLAYGTLHKRWTYVLPDGAQQVHHTAVRLYMPRDLADMLGQVGFANPVFYGDLDRSPLGLESPRCIVVATAT